MSLLSLAPPTAVWGGGQQLDARELEAQGIAVVEGYMVK